MDQRVRVTGACGAPLHPLSSLVSLSARHSLIAPHFLVACGLWIMARGIGPRMLRWARAPPCRHLAERRALHVHISSMQRALHSTLLARLALQPLHQLSTGQTFRTGSPVWLLLVSMERDD